MKKLINNILAFAALSLAAASCVKEAPHPVGEPEADGCYSVYFPVQPKSVVLDPSDPTTCTIAVARKDADGAITVPLVVKDPSEVFEVSELSFEDGATEASITLNFPNAEVGTSYSLSLTIEDNKYASIYGSQPISFDFSVVREKWNYLGKAKYTDSTIWASPSTKEVDLYQNDANKSQFRMQFTWTEADGSDKAVYSPKNGKWFNFWVLQKGKTFASQGIKTQVSGWSTVEDYKSTQDDLVYYDPYDTGVDNDGENIFVTHPSIIKSRNSDSAWGYSRVLQYQPNGLPAGIQLAPVMLMLGSGSGWDKASADGQITIIFPGAVLTDYSIEVEAGIADAGKLPISITRGVDVASVKYAVYEGVLNSAQKAKFADAIADGTEKSAVEATSDGFSITLDKTGVYTIIAVSFDSKKVGQESATAEFGYVAADDDVPVVLSCGIAATNKYVPQGFTAENSLEYYIFGKDIVEAKVGVYSYIDFSIKTQECIEDLMESDPLSEEEIEAINGDGLVDVATGLVPGTGYVLLVYASNGYEEDVFMEAATTLGDPLPIYLPYSMDDINEDLLPEHKDGYFGTYNFYAVDEYGDLGLREKIGQVTIEDSNTPDYVSETGDVDEFFNIKGIFAAEASAYKFEDCQEWDFYHGVFYNLETSQAIGEVDYNGTPLYAHIYVSAKDGYIYKGSPSMLIGGFVEEGYISISSSRLYDEVAGKVVGENGLYLGLHSDETYNNHLGGVACYSDLLFVDPKVDVSDPDAAQASVKAVKARNHALIDAFQKTPVNYLLTPRERAHNIIDMVLNSVNNVLVPASIKGVYDPTSVKVSAKASDVKVVAPKTDWTQTPAQSLR